MEAFPLFLFLKLLALVVASDEASMKNYNFKKAPEDEKTLSKFSVFNLPGKREEMKIMQFFNANKNLVC